MPPSVGKWHAPHLLPIVSNWTRWPTFGRTLLRPGSGNWKSSVFRQTTTQQKLNRPLGQRNVVIDRALRSGPPRRPPIPLVVAANLGPPFIPDGGSFFEYFAAKRTAHHSATTALHHKGKAAEGTHDDLPRTTGRFSLRGNGCGRSPGR